LEGRPNLFVAAFHWITLRCVAARVAQLDFVQLAICGKFALELEAVVAQDGLGRVEVIALDDAPQRLNRVVSLDVIGSSQIRLLNTSMQLKMYRYVFV
jgi:hypothetical protein